MRPDFDKMDGLIPAIIQDAQTLQVLMLGYMDERAFAQTKETGKVTFYSRSKQRLWTKGESSGNYLELVDMSLDCDKDAILILARPDGPTCHTGSQSCFGEGAQYSFLRKLGKIIEHKKNQDPKGSYTASLWQKGIKKIAQKVGEEAVETILEATDDPSPELIEEASDLMYHLSVLLARTGYAIQDVEACLRDRHEEAPE